VAGAPHALNLPAPPTWGRARKKGGERKMAKAVSAKLRFSAAILLMGGYTFPGAARKGDICPLPRNGFLLLQSSGSDGPVVGVGCLPPMIGMGG
jgi:hypothetical protein